MNNSRPPGALRILCCADIHLGRRLAGIPEEEHRAMYSPQRAWERLVDFATDPAHGVDLVACAGDVFDSNDDLFAPFHVFAQGVRRLHAAKVPLIAVAGNHDSQITGNRVARADLPGLIVLGVNGEWQSASFNVRGRRLRVDGRSFTSAEERINPFRVPPPCAFTEDAIGLLHCDLQGGLGSPYAPVEEKNFLHTGHRAWILGHIHTPQDICTSPLTFYCGSLQGLDMSEVGERGGWVLDLLPDGGCQKHWARFAELVWYRYTIDASGVAPEGLQEFLTQDILQRLERPVADVAICRVSLVGRTGDLRAIQKKCLDLKHIRLGDLEEMSCWLEEVQCHCIVDRDLAQLALSEHLPGLVAKRLLLLQGPDGPEKTALLNAAMAYISSMKYPHLELEASEAVLQDELIQVACRVLEELCCTRRDVAG